MVNDRPPSVKQRNLTSKRVQFVEETKGDPPNTKKAKIDFTVRTSDDDFDPRSLSESSSEDDGFGDCVPLPILPNMPLYNSRAARPSKLLNPSVVTARIFRSDSDSDDRDQQILDLKQKLVDS